MTPARNIPVFVGLGVTLLVPSSLNRMSKVLLHTKPMTLSEGSPTPVGMAALTVVLTAVFVTLWTLGGFTTTLYYSSGSIANLLYEGSVSILR